MNNLTRLKANLDAATELIDRFTLKNMELQAENTALKEGIARLARQLDEATGRKTA